MRKLQTAYLFALAFALSAVSKPGFSQFDKSAYSSYRTTADSIVRLYYGDEWLRFISIDSARSYYRTYKGPGAGFLTTFTDTLDFEPETFTFHYYFATPAFNGDTLNIHFYLDKRHAIMPGMLPEGLFDMQDRKELKVITKVQALDTAKKYGIRKPLDNYEIELGWEEQEATREDYKKFNQSNDIKQVVKGRIVWRVKSKFREPPDGDEKAYSDTFVVDAITGLVISIEHEIIDWG